MLISHKRLRLKDRKLSITKKKCITKEERYLEKQKEHIYVVYFNVQQLMHEKTEFTQSNRKSNVLPAKALSCVLICLFYSFIMLPDFGHTL